MTADHDDRAGDHLAVNAARCPVINVYQVRLTECAICHHRQQTLRRSMYEASTMLWMAECTFFA